MLNIFNKWFDEIENSDNQKGEKLIQLVDLISFINAYDATLKIVDCMRSKINIVQLANTYIGIIFYDVNTLINGHLQVSKDLKSLDKTKSKLHLDKIWLVFVLENNTPETAFYESKIKNVTTTYFDQIFLFNFHYSSIKKYINTDV